MATSSLPVTLRGLSSPTPADSAALGRAQVTDDAVRTDRGAESEPSTRQRILRLVVEDGPVSVLDLARGLDLTAAGVRRHVGALEDAGQIAVHTAAARTAPRRGRPARRYVATDRGQAALNSAYSDLAAQALAYLAQVGGPAALEAFAAQRVDDLETRWAPVVAAAGDDVQARTVALAAALSTDGYAASSRPVATGRAVQLCQGHCPVQDVAAQFPQLCEAESRLFSRLLGVHVQRLSTLAAGGHVCTTHVPSSTALAASAPLPPESTTPEPAASDRPAPAETREGTR